MMKKIKKFLLTALSSILVLAIVLSVVGPYLVLAVARQPEVEDSYA